jgi:hypothetical protein
MKTCPACGKDYADDSMVFCLDDGTRLLAQTALSDPNATLNLPQPPAIAPGPTVASPRSTSPPRSTITARPEQFQMGTPYRRDAGGEERSKRSALPWILAIVLVIGVSGILIAWIVTRGRSDEISSKNPAPSPGILASPSPTMTKVDVEITTPSPTPTPDRSIKDEKPRPTPMPTPTKPKPMFAVMNNTSFNGSRITYYPRPSFGLCQADCAGNANCKGFTWIRPGAYNPGDSAMCYLMSAVTARVPHACCISAVRN